MIATGAWSPSFSSADMPHLDEMERLYRDGKYETVRDACIALLEEQPDDPFLLRLKGVCEMDLGWTSRAIATLEKVLEIAPDSIASRYYLAQAYAYDGNLVYATRRLDEIIAMAPDSVYAELARDILPQIAGMMKVSAAMPEARRWNLYLSVRGEYDDNIPARACDDEDTSATDSWRLATSLYGEFRFFDELAAHSPFTLGAGYSFYATRHAEEAYEDYDVLNHRGSLFAEKRGRLFSRSQSVRLAGHYAVTELGGEPHNDAWEAEAEWRLWWARRARLMVHGGWESRSYEHAAEFPEYFSRDGNEWQVGLRHHLYGWNHRVRLGLSYAYRNNDTDGSQYRLRSHQGGAALQLQLPMGFRLSCGAQYAERDYIDFLPEPRRIDDVWTGNAALSHALGTETAELRGGYTILRSSSTRDFAAFKRQVFSMGLNLAF